MKILQPITMDKWTIEMYEIDRLCRECGQIDSDLAAKVPDDIIAGVQYDEFGYFVSYFKLDS